MKKEYKKRKHIFLKLLLTFVFCVWGISIGFSISNYSYNENRVVEYTAEGLIDNQHTFTDMKYGSGPINHTGCGVVATYNFLKLNNEDVDFASLVRISDIYGAVWFAKLGTNVFSIQAYLNMKGYNVKFTTNTKNFSSLAKKSGSAIIGYTDLYGGHLQALNYNETTDNFTFYNFHMVKTMQEYLESNTVGKLACLLYIE